MKKLVCVIIASLVMSTAVYAVEVSLGFSVGAGLPIFYGQDAVNDTKNTEDVISGINGTPHKITLNTGARFDVILGFLPYLALETGVGYKYSVYGVYGTGSRGLTIFNITSDYTRNEIYIPVMLRGQYEYAIGNTYLSAGVKVGFSLSDDYHVRTVTGGILGIGGGLKGTIKSSPVSLDVAFSLGQEFKVKQSHFLGVRFNYDLNVVSPYATSERDSAGNLEPGTILKGADFSHDDFSVEFTYRYVLGRN